MREWIDLINEAVDGLVLHREDDVERANRGFVVDRVTATIAGQKVGSLKIEYIPLKLYRKYYPGILNYLAQIKGANLMPYEEKAVSWRKLNDDGLKRILCYRGYNAPLSVSDFEGQTRQELIAQVEEKERGFLKGKEGKQFSEFREYHVDKPFVAYIEVDHDHRRRGIASALYMEGARWMREKGMVFRSSTLQSDEAQAAWLKFASQGLVKKDRWGRLILYPDREKA